MNKLNNRIEVSGRRILSPILILMFAVLFLIFGIKTQAAGGGTIYVSIERFTLGQGYLVEPVVITYKQGESYADIIERLAKKNNLKLTADRTPSTGRPITSYYLRSIAKADKGKLDIPDIITKMDPMEWAGETVNPPTNTHNDGNDGYPNLGEFAYCRLSGWLYLVNGKDHAIPLSGMNPSNGDVCRLMFTLYGIGKDVENPALPSREGLTKKLALMHSNFAVVKAKGWQTAYKNAVKVISDLDSSKEQMNAANKALPTIKAINAAIKDAEAVKKYTPVKVTLKAVRAGKNKAKVVWKKIPTASGYQVFYSVKAKSGFKKIKTVRKTKTIAFTKTKLRSKKKYYFKVRAFRKVGKKNYFGPFSKVKSVKVK